MAEFSPKLKEALSLVQKPGRYTGGEPGCTYKDKANVDVRMAFCFPDTYEIGGLLSALRFLYRKRRIILRPEVEAAIARYCSAATKRPPAGRPPIVPGDTVAHTALLAGRSREGVSRWFKKIHGLPPQAFQILSRLNHARTLLRSGASPVIASVEAGFADQSHMGRHFLRFFGVTPGRYRPG